MNFSDALNLLKQGVHITRKGWNGKGMHLAYQKGYPTGVSINTNTSEALNLPEGTVCKFLPYILFKTAQGDYVPWVASQTDILAKDWELFSND